MKKYIGGLSSRLSKCFFLTIVFISLSALAKAEEAKLFDIPLQSLHGALIGFAKTCGYTLVVSQDLIEDKYSSAVEGTFEPHKALQIMLVNTGLTGKITDKGQIKIFAVETPKESVADDALNLTEEMIVRGLYGSLQSSMAIKKEAIEIIEVVTEEDIAQMPDQNIAEILQRVPGVQLERRDGVGSLIRIRGLDKNRLTFNGDILLTGLENLRVNRKSYEGSLEGTPIDFIKQVKVYKTPSAQQVEGAIGGIVDLTTRSGFDNDGRFVTTEVSLEQGKYQDKVSPSATLLYSNSWDEIFAINASFSVNTASRTIDSIHLSNANYSITRNHFAASDEYFLQAFEPSVETSKNDRTQSGANVRLDYRPWDNTDLTLEWFSNSLDYEQIAYSLDLALDIYQFDNLEFYDNSNDIKDIKQGVFNLAGGSVISQATKDRVDAENIVVSLKHEVSDHLNLSTRVQSSNSKGTMRYGGGVSRFFNNQLPTWTGLNGSGATSAGWINDTLPMFFSEILVNNSEEASLSLTNLETILSPESHMLVNTQAGGSNIENSLNLAKFDVQWMPTGSDHFKINAGIRYSLEKTDFESMTYLVDYSKTRNVHRPNSVDSSGLITVDSPFDPSNEPPTPNVAISLPVYNDLCGNGGIEAGMECDIDGDGIDDNLGIGPFSTGINFAHSQNILSLQSSSGRPFFELLYNTPRPNNGNFSNNVFPPLTRNSFPFFDSNLFPPYAPSYLFNNAPHLFSTINGVFPTGIFHNEFIGINASDIISDPGEWLQQLIPLSPVTLQKSPINSWQLEKDNLAFYVSTLIKNDFGFEVDLGVRVVENENVIQSATIPEGYQSARRLFDLGDNSFPLIWEPVKSKDQETFVLPSANIKYSFVEDIVLRLNAAKTIAPPSGYDLGQGRVSLEWMFQDEDFSNADSYSGNLFLQYSEVSQYDVAIEYYWSLRNSISLNLFQKELPSFVMQMEEQIDDYTTEEKPVNASIEDIYGAELSALLLHPIGLGVILNYTFIDSEYPNSDNLPIEPLGLPGISRHIYNIIGFYENEKLSVRLAYSRQSEYLAPFQAFSSPLNLFDFADEGIDLQLPYAEIYRPYDQLDARISWNFSENLTTSLDIINLTDSEESSYIGSINNTAQRTVNEPSFIASIKYTF